MAEVVLVRVCFNTRVFFGGVQEADTLVSSPVDPLGDLSETRGEACDASQILSAWSRKYKSALHPIVANGVDFLAIPALERDDWVELGVPIGHRARIVKEHKALHPEMW